MCENVVLWVFLNTSSGGGVAGQTKFPASSQLILPPVLVLLPVTFSNALRKLGSLAGMISCFLCRDPRKHRRVKSPCYLGSRHRHLTFVPARHINAMTVLHGAMNGAEVDALRLPLKKNLTTVFELPARIDSFRGTFARLATAGQTKLLSCSMHSDCFATFPVFHQYSLLFNVAHKRGNGAVDVRGVRSIHHTVTSQHPCLLEPSSLCGKPRRVQVRSCDALLKLFG